MHVDCQMCSFIKTDADRKSMNCGEHERKMLMKTGNVEGKGSKQVEQNETILFALNFSVRQQIQSFR